MSNKVKLALFLVFAVLTFHQFYTFAKRFDLSALVPTDTSAPTVLNGKFTTDSRNSVFDPVILLLALNIALWVERPERIQRAPLILTFIANLSIVILRVGIAAPALKRVAANPQDTVQDSYIRTMGNLSARWNAIYLILATISALIVLWLLIQPYVNKNTLTSTRISFSNAKEQLVKGIALSNKVQLALLLVFALLAFYQFYTYASVINTSALVPPIAPEQITIPPLPSGTRSVLTVDVAVTYAPPDFSFGLPFVLLILNIILWIKRPDPVGRNLLIAAFVANLAIIIIRVIITSPVLNLAPTPQEYIHDFWIIRNFYAKWNLVYVLAATISSLIALGMLVQLLRKR